MSARRILVLGGSGFIGSRLVARLAAEGHDVVIGDTAPSAAFPGLWRPTDVCDLDAVHRSMSDRDTVFNLAAAHRDDVMPKSLYDEVNVDGARNTCRAAADLGVRRIVFTSSVAIYGFSSEERREDDPPRPFNDYGRTKRDAEAVFAAWFAAEPGRTLVVVRPTVVFGERNRGNVYNLVRQIASGRFVMVGNGRNIKSMAYVDNVAACLAWTLDLAAGHHVFNYADKPDFDMNRLVAVVRRSLGKRERPGLRLPTVAGLLAGRLFDVMARVSGKTLPISAIRVKKFTENTRIGSDRVLAAGFHPPIALEAGLRRTLAAEFGAQTRAQEGT